MTPVVTAAVATVAAAVAVAACGGGDLTLPGGGARAAIAIVSGDGQEAPAGTALSAPLVVRVTDALGNPVADTPVSWAVADGSVDPATSRTGADGVAKTWRTLGPVAGRQMTTAASQGLDGSPLTFTHTATTPGATNLTRVSGNDQSGAPGATLPDLLVVGLFDADGNGVAGQAVTWVVVGGGGQVEPATSTTDGEGRAATRLTLGPAAGANAVNAVVSGVGIVEFTATAVEGGGGSGPSASRSSISASPTQIPAGAGVSTITVTVRDASGSPVPGVTVTLEASGGGNVLTQPSRRTDDNGVTTGTLSSAEPGTKLVTAQLDGALTLSETATVEVTAPPAVPARLVFRVQPSDTREDREIRPAVAVAIEDGSGGLVTDAAIEVRLELMGGSDGKREDRLKGETSRRAEGGIATFEDLKVDGSGKGFRLRARAEGLPDVESQAFNVRED